MPGEWLWFSLRAPTTKATTTDQSTLMLTALPLSQCLSWKNCYKGRTTR